MALKGNRKGQMIKIVFAGAIVFLLGGAIATYVVGMGGAAAARTGYRQIVFDNIYEMEGMTIFYDDMLDQQVELELEGLGYDLTNFCPYDLFSYSDSGWVIDPDAESALTGITSQYHNYGRNVLPNPKTVEIEFEAEPESSLAREDWQLDGLYSTLKLEIIPEEPLKTNSSGIKIVSTHGPYNTEIVQTALPHPNLVVESSDATAPDGFYAGKKIIVNGFVNNNGCAAAKFWTIFQGDFEFCPIALQLVAIDDTGAETIVDSINANDWGNPISGSQHCMIIHPKEQVGFSMEWTPANAGTYTLRVDVDPITPHNIIYEADLTDNQMELDPVTIMDTTNIEEYKCGYYHVSDTVVETTARCSVSTDGNKGWGWIKLPRIYADPWNDCLGAELDSDVLCLSGIWICGSTQITTCNETATVTECSCDNT
ncbi:MAG: hypothetical protein ABIG20_02150 [archaeon]